jgi:hypothetical protein
LSLEDTVARAEGLAQALMQFEAFFRELEKLESQVESRLRKLIRKRSKGQLRWRGFRPRRDPAWERFIEGEKLSQFAEQWDAMSPKERAALRDEVREKAG